jgi:hypothetical protein
MTASPRSRSRLPSANSKRRLAYAQRPGPGARTPDEDEAIEAVRLTIAEAAEAVRRGAIVDAKSLVAIAAAERLATR